MTLPHETGLAALLALGTPQPCRPWPRVLLDRPHWERLVLQLEAAPRLGLMALWAEPGCVHAALHDEEGGEIALVSLACPEGSYPALSPVRPGAARFERMVRDLWGLAAEGAADLRPWLDHGAWPVGAPMAARPLPRAEAPPQPAFLPVEGDSLHQIPVGPIHAGIIEPGHFRFTAQGEMVARLEARLGYLHKGTLSLMIGKPARAAATFAARLSGDSTVAWGIAYARAVEAALGIEAPARASWLRALMAELERIANHLHDVGFVCNDAAFAFIHARTGYLREQVLRAAATAFGHRLMMDRVLPGGVADDLTLLGPDAIERALAAIEAELPDIRRTYEDYASLVDRVVGTGAVSAQLVARFGAGGHVGRAASRGFDARRSPGYPPYDALDFAVPLYAEGDVDARVRVRLDELAESIRLVRAILLDLPHGPTVVPLPAAAGEGCGMAESFRGDLFCWVRLDDSAIVRGAFARDPSWLQWPLLEAAIEDNIVADFPLCNKSFNCSYSGADL